MLHLVPARETRASSGVLRSRCLSALQELVGRNGLPLLLLSTAETGSDIYLFMLLNMNGCMLCLLVKFVNNYYVFPHLVSPDRTLAHNFGVEKKCSSEPISYLATTSVFTNLNVIFHRQKKKENLILSTVYSFLSNSTVKNR